MPDDLILIGIDAGTSRIRALAIDTRGAVLAEAWVPTPVESPRPGWDEYSPEAIWHAVCLVSRTVMQRLPSRAAVAGVAVASVGEAAVPVDRDGRPVHPAIAWYDARARTELAELERRVGADRLGALTGLCPDPTFGLCKLLWLRRNVPAAFERTATWLNIADWISFRLSGVAATDYSLASRTMALDIGRETWATEIIDTMDIRPEIFAPLRPSGTLLGPVRPEAAAATGLPSTAAVGVGGHDHICGALAAGVTRPGLVLDSLGTAEAIFMTLDRPLLDSRPTRLGYHQGLVRTAPDHRLPYILGGIPASGGSLEWFRRTCAAGTDRDALIAEAAAVPPGCGGVCFVPHLRFSLAPNPDTMARGAFIGLTADTSRGALFRAVLEGLALEAHQSLAGMTALAGVKAPKEIRVIGGGTRNELFLRIKASAYGRTITRSAIAEASALGAALLGGIAAGAYPDVHAAAAAVRHSWAPVDPDPTAQSVYARLSAEVYPDIYRVLRPLHHRLHPIARETAPSPAPA